MPGWNLRLASPERNSPEVESSTVVSPDTGRSSAFSASTPGKFSTRPDGTKSSMKAVKLKLCRFDRCPIVADVLEVGEQIVAAGAGGGVQLIEGPAEDA